MKNFSQHAFKVGLTTATLLILIAALLIWKSSLFLKMTGNEIVGEFQNIGGLFEQADVRYRGYSVGKVFKIEPQETTVKVRFWIRNDIDIPKDSKLRIIFDGLVGQKYIDIQPRSYTGEYLSSNDVLEGYATSGLADFVDIGTQNLEGVKNILDSIETVMTDGRVSESLSNTLIRLDDIARNVESLAGRVDHLLSQPELASILTQLDRISQGIGDSMDEEFWDNLSNISNNLSQFSEDLAGFLQDSSVKTQVLSTLKEGEETLSASRQFLESVTRLRVRDAFRYEYFHPSKSTSYLLDLNLRLSDRLLRLGLGNRYVNDVKLLHIQAGQWLVPDEAILRYGIVYNTAGFGIDTFLVDPFTISWDVYNLAEQADMDLWLSYPVFEPFHLNAGLSRAMDHNNDRQYMMGVSILGH